MVTLLKATIALLVASVCGAPFASSVHAGNSFDGAWSVSIVSDPGCDNAYAVSIQIENGSIKYQDMILSMIGSGRVSTQGRLTAQIGEAIVNGKLARLTGAGKWHSPKCTGTWTASRAAIEASFAPRM
jgi:hypothetical protein